MIFLCGTSPPGTKSKSPLEMYSPLKGFTLLFSEYSILNSFVLIIQLFLKALWSASFTVCLQGGISSQRNTINTGKVCITKKTTDCCLQRMHVRMSIPQHDLERPLSSSFKHMDVERGNGSQLMYRQPVLEHVRQKVGSYNVIWAN